MTEVRWPQAISILLDFIPCSSPRVLHSSFEPKTLRCASKYFPFVPSSLLHSNIAKMADNGSGHYLGSCLTWDHLDDYRGARQLPMLCYLDTSQRHSADADPEDVQYYGNNLPIWGSISSEVRLRYSSSSLTCEITSPPLGTMVQQISCFAAWIRTGHSRRILVLVANTVQTQHTDWTLS